MKVATPERDYLSGADVGAAIEALSPGDKLKLAAIDDRMRAEPVSEEAISSRKPFCARSMGAGNALDRSRSWLSSLNPCGASRATSALRTGGMYR